jgi:hypothetical protein
MRAAAFLVLALMLACGGGAASDFEKICNAEQLSGASDMPDGAGRMRGT